MPCLHTSIINHSQWDPARDLMAPERKKKEPRKLLSTRAIQIGVARALSQYCVDHALRIDDVTGLARAVGAAHAAKKRPRVMKEMMDRLVPRLPRERCEPTENCVAVCCVV